MAVTYDFQTPGVSTSAADTQQDIRNIAEAAATGFNGTHTLSNVPTGAWRFGNAPSSVTRFQYYNGSTWANLLLEGLNVQNDGRVLDNSGFVLTDEYIRMGALAGYFTNESAVWYIQADVNNVGTSTFDPILALVNQGTERARIYTDTSDSHKLKFDVGGADRITVDSSGNVGIGTSSPQSKIHVWTGNVGGTSPQEAVRIQGDWGGLGSGPLLRFTNEITGGTNPNTNEYNLAGIAAIDDTGSWGGSLVFYSAPTGTTGGSNLVERMTIDSSGNVGIGTSSPDAPLHIEGGATTTLAKFGASSGGDAVSFAARSANNGSIIASTIDSLADYTPIEIIAKSIDLKYRTGVSTSASGLVLDSSGNVTVNTGNLVIGTSGKGIDFSATSGTGTSELLDDYEEGTFTPTLSTTGTNFTSVTYDGNRSGSYTKIGRTVFFTIFMGTDAITKGSASGGITVAGLPFTSNSTLGVGRAVVKLTASNFLAVAPIVGTITENTSYIQLSKRATSVSGDTALQVADIGTGANANFMSISGSYQI